MPSSASLDHIAQSGSGLKERNYLRLFDCFSVGSSIVSNVSEENKNNLNLNATELRLGLLGSQFPESDSYFNMLTSGKLDEKQLLSLKESAHCRKSPLFLETKENSHTLWMDSLEKKVFFY
ncbi:Auxin-responsive protein IAA9 [Abeliophyllum distichum]|uniref:Auxin-responsive protein IAA9 n=1 Tax=Abeliophyllum distichum TaxID=126358 RepID=A0ABD1Q0X5_9LAMI